MRFEAKRQSLSAEGQVRASPPFRQLRVKSSTYRLPEDVVRRVQERPVVVVELDAHHRHEDARYPLRRGTGLEEGQAT